LGHEGSLVAHTDDNQMQFADIGQSSVPCSNWSAAGISCQFEALARLTELHGHPSIRPRRSERTGAKLGAGSRGHDARRSAGAWLGPLVQNDDRAHIRVVVGELAISTIDAADALDGSGLRVEGPPMVGFPYPKSADEPDDPSELWR